MFSLLAVILALVPHLINNVETIWSSLYCRLGADVRRGASQFAEKLSLLEVPQPALPDKVRIMAAGQFKRNRVLVYE